MMSSYYHELNSKSSIRDSLLSFAKSPDTVWKNQNAFDFAVVPVNLLTDKVLVDIVKKFKSLPLILRMNPWQFYRFHIDASRNCAINMLLEITDSNTYFGKETDDEEVLDIEELSYKIDTYYLINTKRKHAVINKNNIRYMFTLGIDYRVSDYDAVKAYCLENNL